MVSAYILARIKSGKNKAVITDVKMVPGVNRIRKTFGAYDLAIEVDFESIEDLDEFVFNKLRRTIKTNETLTVICANSIT